ncbi:unnamed protein product, partial [Ectocarpus sp. 4 AP-2014]
MKFFFVPPHRFYVKIEKKTEASPKNLGWCRWRFRQRHLAVANLGIPVSSNTQGARSRQPRIDRRLAGRYLQAAAAQGEQPCSTRIVTSTCQVVDSGNRLIHPTLPLLAPNLLEPSLRLPLSRRGEPPSSRSRCRNLCAAPCETKPVWNVTLPERSLPPISLQPASTRTRPEFSRVCCSAALGRRCTPLAPVGVRFQGLACSGEGREADFPGFGGIWPLSAPDRTPLANTPTPPGLLRAPLWCGKKHEEQWCG